MSDETRVLATALHSEFWADSIPHEEPCCQPSAQRAIAALEAGGYAVVPTATLEALERVRDAARAVIAASEPDIAYEGEGYVDYIVAFDKLDALRAALEGGPT